MSMRKYYRASVRAMAERRGAKPSKAVHEWRRILDLYPTFKGAKRQKRGSKQPVLKYPVIRKGAR